MSLAVVDQWTFTPNLSPVDIALLYRTRKMEAGVDRQRMIAVRDVMNCEISLPLPELSTDEEPAVANLALQGMQQLARRVSSVVPTIYFPSTSPGTSTADKRARDRRLLMTGWHGDNKLQLRLAKRSRYFLAYASAPVLIKPDFKNGIPRWIPRDPLDTYPGSDTFDDYTPADCIFATQHTYIDLKRTYGPVVDTVRMPPGFNPYDPNWMDTVFDVVEYYDAHESRLVLIGYETPTYTYTGPEVPDDPISAVDLVSPQPNRIGMCPVVVPGAINLDKQLGHFDGILGMYQTQAALMALTLVGQRRTVWPREWLIGRPNETPQVVSIPEPFEGRPGMLQGGELHTQKLDPSFMTLEVMDRLEANQRQTASLPAEFGGMSQSDNVRTGRRGAQVFGAAVDFTLREAQDIFAHALYEEDRRAIAIDKAYWPNRKTYEFATHASISKVNYTADETWETDKHLVQYPIAGTDLQNLPVEGGQRVAMETLSRKSFMELDPVVLDPDEELGRVRSEALERASLAAYQTLASAPDGPFQPVHGARLMKKLVNGMEWWEAIMELQEEIQAEQATPAEEAPQAQPGLSPPGQGVEQPPAVPEGEPSMQNLTQLLGMLGTQQQAQKFRS